jgi:hypothetical protein
VTEIWALGWERVGGSRLTLYVEQLILHGDLRLATSLRLAVDHPLVVRMRLQVHKTSLHVIKNVSPIGRDFLGRKLPVKRDFG